MPRMDEMRRHWGRNIRIGRQALGLKQYELAAKLNVWPSTICRWESGEAAPRDHQKIEVAEALHQDVRQLFPIFRACA